jgi:hypothetical protein
MIRRDDSDVASLNYDAVALSSSWSKPIIKSRNGQYKNRRAPRITAFQSVEIHKMLKTFVSGIVMM